VVTLIKNGFLFDGIGNTPYEADILVSGRKIARIGSSISKRHVDRTLDIRGKMITPGFIDVHARPDFFSSIFEDDLGEAYLSRGITTIMGGNCGISLAPFLHPSQLETMFRHRWRLSVHWDSMQSFLNLLSKRGMEVNFGTFVGYSSLADGIMQGDRRDPSEKEHEMIRAILDQSLAAGAGGISFPLCDPEKRGITPAEIETILFLCKKNKKTAVVCVGEGEMRRSSLNDFFELVRRKKVKVRVSHAEPKNGEQEEVLNLMLNSQARESGIGCDVTPGDLELLPLTRFLPEHWQSSSFEKIQEALFSPQGAEEIKKNIRRKMDEERKIRIARILDPSLKFLEGRTLHEFGENREKNFEDAMLDVMRLTRLEAAVTMNSINRQSVEEIIWREKQTLVSPFMEDPDGFAGFLKRSAEKNAFEKTIAQATSLPALFHGITKRGSIKEGYFADLVILDKDYVPEYVFVNGKIAKDANRYTKERTGMVLRFY